MPNWYKIKVWVESTVVVLLMLVGIIGTIAFIVAVIIKLSNVGVIE